MKTNLTINGMTCDGCRKSVENALNGVQGVESVTVDLKSASGVVTHDESLEAEALLRAVNDAGFKAQVAQASGDTVE